MRRLPTPPSLLITALLVAGVGAVLGVGVFTFGYAKGASYLTNNPAACANCHVMEAHFAGWQKSSHKAVAGCNDCHTPHDVIGKYATKASNGFWHSYAFTTGDFPDPLRIKQHNLEIAEAACRNCHETIVSAITAGPHAVGHGATDAEPEPLPFCTRCHVSVGHRVR